MSGTIVDLLGNLTPELRHAVQVCPDCRRWDKWDEYLLCPVHAGIRLGKAPEGRTIVSTQDSEVSADPPRTPWQIDRDRAEATGRWPESWGPFHRHFANDAVHRDGGPECDQPGTPRRVYVFDPEYLHEHELIVARYAIAHPEQFTSPEEAGVAADDTAAGFWERHNHSEIVPCVKGLCPGYG